MGPVKPKARNAFARATALALTLVLGLTVSCRPQTAKKQTSGSSQGVSSQCFIPKPQVNSIIGKWPKLPLPVAFHVSSNPSGGSPLADFTPAEVTQIKAAIEVWNEFFRQAAGIPVALAVQVDSGLAANRSTCSPPFITSADPKAYSSPIVIYKLTNGAWSGAAHPSTALAITSTCTENSARPGSLNRAFIDVNFDDFFGSFNSKQPDLKSILVHELGHLLGLDHSCQGIGTDGQLACNDTADQTILNAIMFPVYNFGPDGTGEVKTTLGLNDQTRMNCLQYR